jgi:hypothetical protein
LQIILMVGIGNLPLLAGIALLPFQLAILEWYRKSELSCDRAALLETQDPDLVLTSFMKLAGGREFGDTLDLEAFKAQSREYETDDSAWDTVLKAINTAFREHPFFTIRAGELQRWTADGSYAKILAGEYIRRADVKRGDGLGDDIKRGSDYYTDHVAAGPEVAAAEQAQGHGSAPGPAARPDDCGTGSQTLGGSQGAGREW